jgi:exopolyphosphatase/guanosine-5'-triphosphate,3'-diphosphate pyrophosphatase
MRVAAIDCGTNSIRLLIADLDGAGGLADVHREMRVVRLGQGVDATGMLAAEALERTFAAVDDYAALIRASGADTIRFVATSATRDAQNRDVFSAGILARLGVEPEVVTGAEEAALSFAGAASVLHQLGEDPVLVVDLGGGSTEFVLGNASGVLAGLSTDMGCVRFTERFLRSDPPTAAEVAAAVAAVQDAISGMLAEVPVERATALIGVAGSVTTITAHALKLERYLPERIHGAGLAVADVRDACTSLLESTRAQRAALPYMHPGRVDVMGAGALIWRTIVDRVAEVTGGAVSLVTSSEHDILDGIALGIPAAAPVKGRRTV